MKKLLLTIACALAASTAAFAQDAETITTGENGTLTIADNFLVNTSRVPKQVTTSAEASAEWTVADNAVVQYVSYRASLAKTDYLQILATKGAYLQFTLPEYNCTAFTVHSTGSVVKGEFGVYAGDAAEPFYTIVVTSANRNGAIEVSVPEEYQAAGTVYRIVNLKGGKDVTDPGKEDDRGGADNNYRLQMTGITYVCTPKVEETPWAAPTLADYDFDAENGNVYVRNGQTIRFNCEEGATVSGTITYKKKVDGEVKNVTEEFENSEFTFNGDEVSQNALITVKATASGSGHSDSEQATWIFKFNQVKKLFLLNQEKAFVDVVDGRGSATFTYDMTVLNFSALTYPITVTATLTNIETSEVKSETITLNPEDYAAPAPEDGDVAPLYPDHLTGTIIVKADAGNYKASLVADCVSFKNTPLMMANGAAEKEIEITKKTTTGITDIEAEDSDAEAVYYNLNGVRVQPAQGMGLVIRVAGGKATKVII